MDTGYREVMGGWIQHNPDLSTSTAFGPGPKLTVDTDTEK